MPYKNALREKFRQGKPAIGAFFSNVSANVAEMLGVIGLDFIIVDCEHSPMTPESAEGIYRASQLFGMTAMTRIGENSQQHILKYLDAGSEGVQVPLVNTAQDALNVVASVKYPPVGKRGMAGPRLAAYGRIPLGEFSRQWNEEGLVCIQIETQEAIDNFAEINAVPGVDIIFFGPTDLSMALGHPGETSHPEVISVIERLGKQVIDSGKVAGTIVGNVEQYQRYRGQGFLYCATAVTGFLARGAREHLAELAECEKTLTGS
jgi:4-hydroxy-2-oxoheptanedioate aldolase